MTADALVVEFEVGTSLARAFATRTERCAIWWPPAHTVSGDAAAITFEPYSGGRIFERSVEGVEYEWGRMLDWEPPRRLRYRWHLFFDPSEATEVEVTFTAVAERTAVRLEQTGWDRLGEPGVQRRARTGAVWARLVPAFIAAAEV